MSSTSSTVRVERDGADAYVVLARPGVRNAFNAAMIADLTHAFEELDRSPEVRSVELRGDGPVFSAGADVNWMRSSLDLSVEENVADATAMATMFRTIDRCSKPVIARVHGAAIAGGSGLCAVCDIVVAAEDAVFGFTEAKLGIIPAVISPFVIAKIGRSHARALFLTARRFDAHHARRIGLVHDVVAEPELDATIDAVRSELASSGRDAMSSAKRLIERVACAGGEDVTALTAEAIAAARTSAEGREGIRAFLERRPPRWRQTP